MKYSKELVDEICANISNGVINKDAAILSGISEATFYLWQKENDPNNPNEQKNPLNDEQRLEFLESIKKAEAQRKRNFISSIVKASNKTWQAAAWYLERVYPSEFGRLREMEVKGDGKIEVIVKDYD